MNQSSKKLLLQNFQETYKKGMEQKLLQQALVYLKLREHGCPKTRALIFAKKKQVCIDGTVKKDGPAGFRKLRPEKPLGRLNNGWVKGQKLKYTGLRGFSEEIINNVSKQKLSITKYNKVDRAKFQQLRLKLQQKNQLNFQPSQKNKFLEQIGGMKDQFSKDKEKRNLFLSYEGLRLDQYTKSYFEKIQDIDPDSYILKLGAFGNPINDEGFKLETDWEIAKGRSMSSYEIQGQKKRKEVIQFRKSLTNLKIPSQSQTKKQKKFRATLHNSNKQLMRNKKYEQKEFEEFYGNIDKMIWLKTKKSMPEISARVNQEKETELNH